MTDYFALLDEPRSPWIEPDSLKQKFLSRSAQVHPDRVHNATPTEKDAAQTQYTELNAAYTTLREPKNCLRHFLELETGAKPKEVQTIPQSLMDQFFSVAQVCREADTFLARKTTVSSPLLHVQLFEQGQTHSEKLIALQHSVHEWRDQLLRELKQFSEHCASKSNLPNREATLQRLEEIYRLLSYYNRWEVQLQERIFQLAS